MTWLSNHVVDHLRAVAGWPQLPGDRYVIERATGRGGMGTVYAALDERLGRQVAIKVSNAAAPKTALDARLRQEAEVLASLEHPGIVPVHDAGVLDDGRLFYVMKLVRGETLDTHTARVDGEAALLGLFERLVQTVAFAHTRRVIHRDLKPSNVMVGSFGEVLVLDWGVAKVLGNAESDVRVGTPGFMAPEQMRGDDAAVGPTADVHALGALLSWMLKAASIEPTRRLRAIAQKCQAADPARRYADASELAADLALYRAGVPVGAYQESKLEQLGQWVRKYQTFILLIAVYLLMRAAFAWFR